jgi:hypothetical protein
MQTRRAKLSEKRTRIADYLSSQEFLQAMSKSQPLALKQLFGAIPSTAREILSSNIRNILPRYGDYRYGEDFDDLYYIDTYDENTLLNTALREYRDELNPHFTSNDFAALRYCTRRGFERCVDRLLQYPVGVNSGNVLKYPIDINVNDGEPLFNAIGSGNVNIVRKLLAKGAKWELMLSRFEATAVLVKAINSDNIEMVDFVLSKGVSIAKLRNDLIDDEHTQFEEFEECFSKSQFPERKNISSEMLSYVLHLYGDGGFITQPINQTDNISSILHLIFLEDYTPEQKMNIAQYLFTKGIDPGWSNLLEIATHFDDSYLPLVKFLYETGRFQITKGTLYEVTNVNYRWRVPGQNFRINTEILRYLISQVPVGTNLNI